MRYCANDPLGQVRRQHLLRRQSRTSHQRRAQTSTDDRQPLAECISAYQSPVVTLNTPKKCPSAQDHPPTLSHGLNSQEPDAAGEPDQRQPGSGPEDDLEVSRCLSLLVRHGLVQPVGSLYGDNQGEVARQPNHDQPGPEPAHHHRGQAARQLHQSRAWHSSSSAHVLLRSSCVGLTTEVSFGSGTSARLTVALNVASRSSSVL